uniref:PD-(D/E)XK nuclease family transposase n=1 Tax=Oceanospirillum beijerinckii TaxID=64976 RepID=UPI000481AF47
FRHLHELEEIPPRLREKVFLSLFEKANIAQFQPEERQAYESSLKYYRDLKNVIDTARDEGREEGREEGLEEGEQIGYEKAQSEAHQKMALAVMNLVKLGLPDQQVAEAFQLSVDEIQEIKQYYQ